MKYVTTLLLIFCFLTDGKKQQQTVPDYNSVEVDTLLKGDFSCRALLIDGKKLWYGATKSRYGYLNLETGEHIEKQLEPDSMDFRSIAHNAKTVFFINAGSPAMLYRVDKNSADAKIVYTEKNKKAFYDSMRFWNNKEGIAMGDPTNDCLSILITRDGGQTWKKSACRGIPDIEAGEAAFAASNTNIVVNGNNTWLVTGGKKARVFFSSDKGKSWRVYNTPIASGGSYTGIFTADFYDAKTGFIAGGDYSKPNEKTKNKAITTDGGKTWKLVAENEGFGYASCARFLPGAGGKAIVTVGASGLYYSTDSGEHWKQLHNDYTLNTIRFANDSTAYAAGKDKIVRLRFKKN